MRVSTWMKGALAVLTAAQVASMVLRASRRTNLAGKTALVCGASRGLGRAIALELARKGCKVAVCARSGKDLEVVRQELVSLGAPTHAETCDLRIMEDVESLVANVTNDLGPIDVLVVTAASITVGPAEVMTPDDFDEALDSILRTSLHAALAVLPGMRERRRGTLAFVTSLGGKVAVPHLLPYSIAKFAEVGLADGLRAETAKDGVHVLDVVPGLMRTGSHVHGMFKGDAEKEYAWFGASATAPGPFTIEAERAARRITRAIERGDDELVLTPAAKLAVRVNGLAPSLVRFVMKLADRLLPAPLLLPEGLRAKEGLEVEAASHSEGVAYVQARGTKLADRHHQRTPWFENTYVKSWTW